MSSISDLTNNGDSAKVIKPEETEEESFRQKCVDLQSKISEVESNTSLLSLAISRSTRTVKRLRTEYLVLLEALERKSASLATKQEEVPSSPELELEDINQLLENSILKLSSRSAGVAASGVGRRSATAAAAARRGPRKIKDPNFPKRPTNAYLLYCEGEKERIKSLPLEEQSRILDLSKHLTEGWKSLDDESRKPYYKIYEQDKERFARELEEYERKKKAEELALASEPPASPSVTAATPELEDSDLVHPAVKKIKLEEAVSSSPPPQSLDSSPTRTPTPVLMTNPETEDDGTGVDDEDDDDNEDDGVDDEDVILDGDDDIDPDNEEEDEMVVDAADDSIAVNNEEAEDELADDGDDDKDDNDDDDDDDSLSTPAPAVATEASSIVATSALSEKADDGDIEVAD